MTEPKLEPMKKEEIDSMFSDEKGTTKKNKKKNKGKNKKKNEIDLFDYAKEKGLDINLQYEDPKPVEFDFDKKNYNNNSKINQPYNKEPNTEKKENKIEMKEKEKVNNKKEEKKKNQQNKKGDNNKKPDNKSENNNENYDEEYKEEKYDNFKYDEYFKNDNNYFKEQNYQNDKNYDKYYYNNYNNNSNNNNFNNKNSNNRNNYNRKNYNNNYYNYNDYNNNYNNNYKKKNNSIAIEIPDNQKNESETKSQNNSNQKSNQNQNVKNNVNNIPNNRINQINIQNNIYNQFFQANLISNYQAEMMRMNYFSGMENLNSNLYSDKLFTPLTDTGTVEMLDKFFSEKNLNRDLNLRKNMDPETGNVPLNFILNLNKMKSLELSQEKISQYIQRVGSDVIELVNINGEYYLKPKNFEEIKKRLISIEQIEEKIRQKNKNQNIPQQNITMGMPPMYFYPFQPMMYYNQMMVPSQQNLGNKPVMANQTQNEDEGNK